MDRYPVWQGEKRVGWAQSERQGMYLLIRCVCDRLPEGQWRVRALCKGKTVDLGRCVPEQGRLKLRKRVREKELSPKDCRFELVQPRTEEWEPISEDSPFSGISRLKDASFQERAGVPGILFHSSSSPTGQ